MITWQSKDLSFEAPFMFLFIGNNKAILFDTGATNDRIRFPLRKIVDAILEKWLSKNKRENYELIVAHTHEHNDHTSGDTQFLHRANTKVIAKDFDSVGSFFGIQNGALGTGKCDLGGRVLIILPIPGQYPGSISI